MIVVLDTNVIVSALLSPFGPPGRILDLVLAGLLRPAFDDRILAEYRQVLNRPRFAFPAADIAAVLDYFVAYGQAVVALPLNRALPDADDLAFLEVAAAAGAVLVTGNLAHFPESACSDVQVLTPAAFLEQWSVASQS